MTEQNLNPDALAVAALELDMPCASCAIGNDPNPCKFCESTAERVIREYLSALPAQPDTVTSVEELEALPQESVIRSVKFGVVRERFDSGWIATCANGFDQSDDIAGRDHVVLYKPVDG